MCSFIFSNIRPSKECNFFAQRRGPDKTSEIKFYDFYFIHNLLSITGTFSPQPFIDISGDICLIYNGEIYNPNSFDSDGKLIIPLYKEYGFRMPDLLDGEFAICLLDLKNSTILLSTDLFSTKPIWWCIEDGNIGIASYQSSLLCLGFKNPKKLPANTKILIDLNKLEIKNYDSLYSFCLDQTKDSFDDWDISFSKSINKRTRDLDKKIFIGLSSGYDSGCISCELNKQNIDYSVYTIYGRENRNIINERSKLLKENVIHKKYNFNSIQRFLEKKYIKKFVEPFEGYIYNDEKDFSLKLNLIDDRGGRALSYICKKAAQDNHKVFLSGSGADEIFSDYGFGGKKIFKHSNFGGLFPDDLTKIFPWASFYSSSQEAYIAKEEHIAGSYGIETRYPYLDKAVVQEFLLLEPSLKNKNYKSVLFNYMTKNNYPFQENKKIGLK